MPTLPMNMHFPVYFDLFGLHLHAHQVMEVIAYAGGFQLYLWLRGRWRREGLIAAASIPFEQTMWVLVGCVFGALFGSKLLAWAESWPDYWQHRHVLAAWLGGKTIVGGLLGGWVGVEIAKWCIGVKQSTGDLFVFPLIFGMAVGRIGCFLTGLDDHTHGIATSLPWGVDFGDGIRRHPTQLYEMVFLLAWGMMLLVLLKARRHPDSSGPCSGTKGRSEGRVFRVFMLGYLAMRFAIEFIKPIYKPYLGLSAIQLACLAGIIACGRGLVRAARVQPIPETTAHV